jgi:hypothetical protein
VLIAVSWMKGWSGIDELTLVGWGCIIMQW